MGWCACWGRPHPDSRPSRTLPSHVCLPVLLSSWSSPSSLPERRPRTDQKWSRHGLSWIAQQCSLLVLENVALSHMTSFSSSRGWRTRTVHGGWWPALHWPFLSNSINSETMAPLFHTCDPLSVPSRQMVNGSTVTYLASLVLSFLFSSNTSARGLLSSLQTRPSWRTLLLVRLLLVLLATELVHNGLLSSRLLYGYYCGWVAWVQVAISARKFAEYLPSRVSALIRYVGTVTRASKVPVSCSFFPAQALCVFFVALLLSLAVLAGLLPQLTTYNYCFTYVEFQATPHSSQ